MKVLAVDPGYDRLGVAVMEYVQGKEHLIFSTCIETSKEGDMPERLHILGDALLAILTEHNPSIVAVETLFFNKNQKTAMAVAEARGIIIYLARSHGCAVLELGPQEIKVAVTGYGKSDKLAVIDMVKRLVPDAPKRAHDDEYDAIAVGIACLAHTRAPGGVALSDKV
jgi:crossover junction endodeoxyribonuclease RuvC